jgi:hypothetical protein
VQDGLFEGEEAVLHVIERIVAPLGLSGSTSRRRMRTRDFRMAAGCIPDEVASL